MAATAADGCGQAVSSTRMLLRLLALVTMILLADSRGPAAAAQSNSSTSGICPSQPLINSQASLSDHSSLKLVPCKVLIVGGGPGGLFSAYLLRHLGRELCMVEKKAVWGGKMQANAAPPVKGTNSTLSDAVGTCGLRIVENMRDMRCLMSQLGIRLEASPWDDIYHTGDRYVRNPQDLLGLPKDGSGGSSSAFPGLLPADPGIKDLADAMVEFALLGTRKVNPLSGKQPAVPPSVQCANYNSVGDYLKHVFGETGFDFLMAAYNFKGDYLNPNDVCGYIDFMKQDWKRCCTFYYPVGGFPPVYAAIQQRLEDAGVRMFKSTEVKCLSQVDPIASAGPGSNVKDSGIAAQAASNTSSKAATNASSLAADTPRYKYVALVSPSVGFKAERLIINAGPIQLKNITGNLGSRLAGNPVINSIEPTKTAVYQVFFPERWWEKYGTVRGGTLRLMTDQECTTQLQFLGAPNYQRMNATRIVYTDDPKCVSYWEGVYAKGGLPAVRKSAWELLKRLFPMEKSIPPPTGDAFFISPNSWHFLKAGATKKGITVDGVKRWALKPFGDASLCMVGEAFNIQNSGWSQGAWDSAVNCVSSSFADLLTSEAKQQLQYIVSGCNGAKTFSNEHNMPAIINQALPGINPATGKPDA